MLRVDRICVIIFIFTFAMLIPGVKLMRYADELATLALAAVATLDCVVNHNWRRYKLLWIMMAIMTGYLLYSLLLPYNTPRAIALDWLIQLKPFIPFVVTLAVAPEFTSSERVAIKIISVINVAIIPVIWALGDDAIVDTIQHPSYLGITTFVSASAFYFASIEPDGRVSPTSLAITVIMLAVGLTGGRSKYFGSAVFATFMLVFYTPHMMKRFGRIAIISWGVVIGLVLLVGWHKFEEYFLAGDTSRIDTEMISTIARPMLYAVGGMILIDHIPLGSGLASFASFASADSYSEIYHIYKLDKVWGLSPEMPEFICDAFYPSLAQFGIVGIALFGWFWLYVAKMLRALVRTDSAQSGKLFALAWTLIVFLLIESVASTTFVQSGGLLCMMLLAMICARSPIVINSENQTTVCNEPTK